VTNTLYYGDNLDVLRQHIADESVDLVYLDPPFNSNANYNALFGEQDGARSAAQIQAFTDTWRWDQAAVVDYERTVEKGGKVADALMAMRTFLGPSDTLAYLSMMAPRLVELRRVLKPTGSIYLHCDPTASHYLKVLFDAVFGAAHFRNEIIWCYTGPGSPRQRQFSRKHDVIFWYSRGDAWTFNAAAVRIPHSGKTLENYKQGLVGSGFVAGDEDAVRGKIPEDYWPIAIAPRGKEYFGYPTQKPLALLERIVAASSNPGDVVLDPFCGCGTAVDAAQRLGRGWIGIDITHLAINLVRHRLMDAYGDDAVFDVIGEPTDIAGAQGLAASDPYQFQWWALGLVGARPVEQKKGADRGIDGRLLFHDEQGGETKQVILSVKAGHIHRNHVHELRGVVEREHAAIGVLLSMESPTRPMGEEAADAGSYDGPWGQHYPRLQLLTVGDLLDGRKIDMSDTASMAANVTHKRAPKAPPRDPGRK
jgi:DNA modification methylase